MSPTLLSVFLHWLMSDYRGKLLCVLVILVYLRCCPNIIVYNYFTFAKWQREMGFQVFVTVRLRPEFRRHYLNETAIARSFCYSVFIKTCSALGSVKDSKLFLDKDGVPAE